MGKRKAAGWKGKISREKAEEMLGKSQEKTYLLREGDEISSRTVSSLETENNLKLDHCLVTFVGKEKKISELLLLNYNGGWVVYKDEPNLSSTAYKVHRTLDALLKSEKLQDPLMKEAS